MNRLVPESVGLPEIRDRARAIERLRVEQADAVDRRRLGAAACEPDRRDNPDRDSDDPHDQRRAPPWMRSCSRPLDAATELPLRRRLRVVHLDDADRLVEALQPLDSPEAEGDALRCACELADRIGGEHLARLCQRAKARRTVERAATEAVLDRHRLTRVDPDPDRARKLLGHDRRLQLDRESQRSPPPSRRRRAPRLRGAPEASPCTRARSSPRSRRTVSPARRRPRRHAHGCSSCSHERLQRGTCARPAPSVAAPPQLDDDRNRAAVGAPGGARDIARAR